MKQSLLRIALGIIGLVSILSSQAQNAKITLYNAYTNPDLADAFMGAAFYGISDNGKYAVGFSAEYSDYVFLWNRATGEFRQITGSFGNRACVYDVSDNGVVVGTFADDNNGEVKEDGTPYMIPGYWIAGMWTPLELEIDKMAGDVNGEARTISPDGRVITGYIYGKYEKTYYDTETGDMNAVKMVNKYRPAVWIDGKLQPIESLPSADVVGQGIVMNYASTNGEVLGGFAEHDTGTRSPAIWKDGQLIRILGKEDIDLDKEGQYWFAGYVACVSPSGKWVCGTWNPEGDGWYAPQYAFVYNVETEEVEMIEDWGIAYYITDDGLLFGKTELMGTPLVRTQDFSGSLEDYLKLLGVTAPKGLPESVQCVSADGSVFAGWYLVQDDFGPVMMPSVAVLENATVGIEDATADNKGITCTEGAICAPGAVQTEAYDIAGRLIATTKGESLPVNGLKGMTIVKVVYANGETATKQFLLK